jgi:molybdenum cofactor guanylyltransferase
MVNQITCAGVVLGGGESRRFGSPKMFAAWSNKSFFELSLDSIAPISDVLIAVIKKEWIKELTKCTHHDVKFVQDIERFKGKGPLAGIYSAMISKKADYYLIIPCDMPLMSSVMYEKWLKAAISYPEYDCIIPVIEGKIYPLNGVYKPTCLPEIKACLNEGTYKVLQLLERKRTYYIEVSKKEEHHFLNVNTVKDIKQLIQVHSQERKKE